MGDPWEWKASGRPGPIGPARSGFAAVREGRYVLAPPSNSKDHSFGGGAALDEPCTLPLLAK
jgi:hypothetical protein